MVNLGHGWGEGWSWCEHHHNNYIADLWVPVAFSPPCFDGSLLGPTERGPVDPQPSHGLPDGSAVLDSQ